MVCRVCGEVSPANYLERHFRDVHPEVVAESWRELGLRMLGPLTGLARRVTGLALAPEQEDVEMGG